MNRTAEKFGILLIRHYSAAFRSEMGVIIHPVKQVRNARFGRNDPEKSTHRFVAIVLIIKKIPVRDVRLQRAAIIRFLWKNPPLGGGFFLTEVLITIKWRHFLYYLGVPARRRSQFPCFAEMHGHAFMQTCIVILP